MKKTLKILTSLILMTLVVITPINVGCGKDLPIAAKELITVSVGSVFAKDRVQALSVNTSKAPTKSVQATADDTIKYSSLKAVNPVSAPTSLDDFTLATNGTVNTSGGTLSYSRKVKVEATAYCSCYSCCGPYDGTSTADGSRPKAYYTIATSRFFSFGTMVYIPGFDDSWNHGVFEVEDRGGAIQNNRIDIYFNTHEEALQFGRRQMEIYILK